MSPASLREEITGDLQGQLAAYRYPANTMSVRPV